MSEIFTALESEPLSCVIINRTDTMLGDIKGAEVVTEKECFARPDADYDMVITVADPVSSHDPLYKRKIGSGTILNLLICPSERESTGATSTYLGYDGVIQCEPALTTSLLKDLIEPLTEPKLISLDYQDVSSLFSTHRGKVYYQRYGLANNQCPELVMPSAFNQLNRQLGLLLVLTIHEDTDFSLLQTVSKKVDDIESVALSMLGDRRDEPASEALGILWFRK